MTVTDLKLERARRIDCALDMKPDQLIQIVTDDFERGEYKNATAMIVIVIVDEEGDDKVIESYRCGVDRAQEIGYVQAWLAMRLQDWRVK